MKGRGTALKCPLLGSAAAHLLLLALLLFVGVSVDTHVAQVVPVILVEGAMDAPSGAGETVAASLGGAPREDAVRAAAPLRSPSAPPAPLAMPSPGPLAVSSKSPAAPAQAAVRPPEPAGASLAVKPPPLSTAVASLSHDPAFLASVRIGGGAASPAARGGADLPGAGAGSGGKGGDLPGPAAGGAAGGRATAALVGPGASGPAQGGSGVGKEGPESGLLRARIQSRIVYPEEAIRRGQEGEVLLRIRIGEGGVPKEIRVARSSGARVLDEAARRGVVRAAPLPFHSGWVEVPVRFFLRPL